MRHTIEFKYFSIDFDIQWDQFANVKRYNWIELDWLKVYTEADRVHGTGEIELYLLGFGIRFYWVYNQEALDSKMDDYKQSIANGKWRKV